jgi:hypothetical protein
LVKLLSNVVIDHEDVLILDIDVLALLVKIAVIKQRLLDIGLHLFILFREVILQAVTVVPVIIRVIRFEVVLTVSEVNQIRRRLRKIVPCKMGIGARDSETRLAIC